METKHDFEILRYLVKQYLETARQPEQDQRRNLWRRHNSLKMTRPPVLVMLGFWNAWLRDYIPESSLRCSDPFFRGYERMLRLKLFHATLGDDTIFEPWISQGASHVLPSGGRWGIELSRTSPDVDGGAFAINPPLKELDDIHKLLKPRRQIDEAQTAANLARLRDAVGDLIEIDAVRGTAYAHFGGDISTDLIQLRGMEQVMIDMYENPQWLHGLLAFMRDGILAAQDKAEALGDFSLSCHDNQSMAYSEELEDPHPNSGPRRRKQLWGFMAAQEFTLVSPQFHEEFLLRYQLPIIAKYGLSTYGCCEDLTNKIDMLRQIPNLRRIAVTPTADIGRCAEQIGGSYVISWRPNPTDMVSAAFDEGRIRRIIREGLSACRDNGCVVDITLKDIETVQGEPDRLSRWVRIVREETDGASQMPA